MGMCLLPERVSSFSCIVFEGSEQRRRRRRRREGG